MSELTGDLARKAQSGDRQAFSKIVEIFQRRVFRAAYAVVRNMEEADEITQEVFVRLFKHIDSIENPEAIKAWLLRTAINAANDRLRWIRIRGWLAGKTLDAYEVGSNETSPEKSAAIRERREIVNRWTEAHLSSKERTIFQLRFGEDMTIAEISDVLSMNENTVKTHLHRAHKKLRALDPRCRIQDANKNTEK